jgi:AcrR family transcriptional regulator
MDRPTAHPPSEPASQSDETRSRLLGAAADVFAEVGFHRATVRDICTRAGANVAAINYHFGDKEGLYAEVVKGGVALGLQKYPVDMGVPQGATAEQRLHGFVRSFLYRTLGAGGHARPGRIMLWEMVEPTPVLDALFRERIRILYVKLEEIVRDLLGKAAAPALVRMGCASVLGQCTFYRMGASLLSKVQPGVATSDLPPAQVEALAEHITFVTANGLKAYAHGGAGFQPASAKEKKQTGSLHPKEGHP